MNPQIALISIAIVGLVCAVQLGTSSPLADHSTGSMAHDTPTPTPFLKKTPVSISSPRPDAPKVSSVSIPKSKEVDSAIHTLKTKTGEPLDANNADLDGANTIFFGIPYGGFGFGGIGYPGFGYGGVWGR
jgi:hypothetical protein